MGILPRAAERIIIAVGKEEASTVHATEVTSAPQQQSTAPAKAQVLSRQHHLS